MDRFSEYRVMWVLVLFDLPTETKKEKKAYVGCFQWLKVTKMKANHNCNRIEPKRREAVSNGPKLLK